MDFANIYAQGFARLAARVLPVKLANPGANAASIADDLTTLDADGVCLAVYPQLCLTGVSCGDLFAQDAMLDAAEDAIAALVDASRSLRPVIVVGAPVRRGGQVYNCAVVIHGGDVQAFIPKCVPDGVEQGRWFANGAGIDDWLGLRRWPRLGGRFIGRHRIDVCGIDGLSISIGFGQDISAAQGVSGQAVLDGATVLVNLDGAPTHVGTAQARKLVAKGVSASTGTVYVLAAPGPGESSTDAVWDGQSFIYECGELLGESNRYSRQPGGVVADIDLIRLRAARQTSGLEPDQVQQAPSPVQLIDWAGELPGGDIGLRRRLSRFPFVPDEADELEQCCQEARAIQVAALVTRLSAIGPDVKAVIGVSGGLDSTNALLVAAGAMDELGRPRTDILAFTMPGFATSAGTKSHAWRLMEAIGVTAGEIDIRPAATQMMKDLGHADNQYDVTFENIQAGLRADYLFRVANQRGGIVVGTGDLSEAALGWCTYGVGDHMSHYNVNAGLPKTLMQYLIRWQIAQRTYPEAADVLAEIVAQEISPELVPVSDGEVIQSTESAVGPYALNDFFLHQMLVGAPPSRIAYLAWKAWGDAAVGAWPLGTPDDQRVAYDLATIRGWLVKFYRRFFTSQFKRSASPDGPQLLPVSLGPRGGLVMPSDANPRIWLDALAADVPA